MKLRRLEKINLHAITEIDEKWIQERIAEDPSILGLGDVILKDKERIHKSAGRLDLLLQDVDTNRRYEIELQLGRVDESHIIRTIEYWDIERKRYPQYEHCAVIIAEEITSRFLNVISLFNGNIPIIAIKMDAYKVGADEISLSFTTVLDELTLGLVDEDEEVSEVTDRAYWIKRGTEETVQMADTLLGYIKEFTDDDIELKYNKFYIGLSRGGRAFNFTAFRPRKKGIGIEIKLPFTDDTQSKIDEAGLDDIGYDKKWNSYRLRLTKKDLKDHKELLQELINSAYQSFL
jgi:predicted transport protein